MNTDHAIKQLDLSRTEALAIMDGDEASSFGTWKPVSRLTLEPISAPDHSIVDAGMTDGRT